MSVVRGKTAFAQVTKVGELDDKGKVVLSVGYGGKMIADKKRPMASLVINFYGMVKHYAHWESLEQAEEDLATIRYFFETQKVRPVEPVKPKGKSCPKTKRTRT